MKLNETKIKFKQEMNEIALQSDLIRSRLLYYFDDDVCSSSPISLDENGNMIRVRARFIFVYDFTKLLLYFCAYVSVCE